MLSKLLPLVSLFPFVLSAPALDLVSAPNATSTVFSAPGSNSSTTAASSTTYSASASTSGASTQSGINTIPLSSYSFTPYPTPTLNPRPPVYPATDPLNPPDVSSDPQVVPDFTPAWATAYQKAKNLVCKSLLSRIAPFFNYSSPVESHCLDIRLYHRGKGQYHHWRRLDERPMRW